MYGGLDQGLAQEVAANEFRSFQQPGQGQANAKIDVLEGTALR